MREEEKMLAGALYRAGDPELVAKRERARGLLERLCRGEAGVLPQLLGAVGAGTEIVAPFFCDYGSNIVLGARVFLNTGCVVLDSTSVEIGDDALLGPGVHLYTATHPLDPALRREGLEFAAPVTIGPGAWIGGRVVVCPGVRIGAGSTVGAGSVVTRDVPPGVVAAGNPCRVLRPLDATPAPPGGGGTGSDGPTTGEGRP